MVGGGAPGQIYPGGLLTVYVPVGRSLALPYSVISVVGRSLAQPFVAANLVGASRVFPYTIKNIVGRELAQSYLIRNLLGRSLDLQYGVATPVPIPGKENVDSYLDGASEPFGGAIPMTSDLSIFATFVSTPWSPKRGLEEAQYGRLPYREAQETYGQRDADVKTLRRATAGWHGTAFEPQEGSYALVARDGPLADLVGKRLRVSFMDAIIPRRTFVYVLAAAPLNEGEDISLTRRPYLALERLTRVPVEVQVEEVPTP
jgi:hypothetical protein